MNDFEGMEEMNEKETNEQIINDAENPMPDLSSEKKEYALSEPAEISYNAPKKDKKKKNKKAPSFTAIVAICLATVIVSGAVSFGGTYLAGMIRDNSYAERYNNAVNSPLVIYRDVSGVQTSAGDGELLSTAQIAELVRDSVVEINTEYTTRSMWFQYLNQGGAGSGVILTADGYIVTNAHVIMNEDETALAQKVTVRLANGNEYEAQVKGYDSEADIAVLKIEEENLIPAQCGNSDTLAVGEELVVVGNPLGKLGGTVTNGIVSATERNIEVEGQKMTLIQTNAAINPGNSGGGMFNAKGQLVGIVNAKSAGTAVEGLGFAIPINDALTVTEQLMEYGYVRGKVDIGVLFRDVTQNQFYYYYNIKPGVYVDSLVEGLNDDVLKVGDRIIAVNSNEISSSADIMSVVSECAVGDKIKFQLYRDGHFIEVEVTCYEKVPGEQTEITFSDEEPEY